MGGFAEMFDALVVKVGGFCIKVGVHRWSYVSLGKSDLINILVPMLPILLHPT